MTDSHTPTSRLRSSLCLLFVGLLAGALASPAPAQTVASVVDNMQARYERQMETVDTYVVETNLYTSYNKKVMTDGEPTYQTQTKMKSQGGMGFSSTGTPSSAYGLQFDRLREHATYAETETIDGTRCHVLQVNDPSKVNPEMKGDGAERMTYYVDAEQHVPVRMVMKQKTQNSRGPGPSSVTVNMKDYQTTNGLTLPHRMEIQLQMNMSEQQRKKMERMMKKMENMPKQQREQMEKMMGDQMESMRRMMSGKPIVVTVQDVKVNVDLPKGTF
jgi:hypothetical protein